MYHDTAIFEACWSESDFEAIGPESQACHDWFTAFSERLPGVPSSFPRKYLIGGSEVTIDWRRNVQDVFRTQSYGDYFCDIENDGEENSSLSAAAAVVPANQDKVDLGYTPEEDLDGSLALLHPYIFCRLICMPMANEIEVVSQGGMFHAGFSAVATNSNGVTYGDVMQSLAKQ